MQPDQDSIRLLLKNETSVLHREIEDAFDILDPDFTLPQYKDLLLKFYGFYFPIELDLSSSAVMTESMEWPLRAKRAALEKDLRNLGLKNFDSVKLCLDLPPLHSKASIFGVLYVLEGSTLGGQVISKHLKEKLQIDPEINGSFYFSYGPNTGLMWRKFLTALEAEVTSDEDRQAALLAAQETFRKLAQWLKE